MAGRALELRAWPGASAAALVAALILGTLAAVALRADPGRGLGPADWAAIRFTLWQSFLSATFSCALAVPVARALGRRRFLGRPLLVTLLGAPFILPVIVAVLGLLAVFGRNGLLNQGLRWADLPEIQIYGLHGVVLAHVFFNLPLATRLILQGWQAIPAERFRLAAQLDFPARAVFLLIELPMLRRMLPGAWTVVFAISLSSFAVALTLGGGPRATTVELAIYQAFRFDFDLTRAAVLGTIQILLAGGAALLALKTSAAGGFGAGLDRVPRRWDCGAASARAADALLIFLAMLFLLLPLAAVVARGLPGLVDLPPQVWRATVVSIAIAAVSTVLLLALAVPMAVAAAAPGMRWTEAVGLLGIAASPLVIGTGLFIMIHPIADPFALALPVTALVNAVMALPFALRILAPATRDVVADYGRLSHSLDIRGIDWLRIVLIPRLRAPLGFSAGLGAALSLGDLGVVALFADPEFATLPLQMYRLMGSYQTQAAAGAGLLLLTLSLVSFWLLDLGGRGRAQN